MGTAYYTIKWRNKDGTTGYPLRPVPLTKASADAGIKNGLKVNTPFVSVIDGQIELNCDEEQLEEFDKSDLEKGEWPVSGELVEWEQYLKGEALTPEERLQELFEFYLEDVRPADRTSTNFMEYLYQRGYFPVEYLKIYLGADSYFNTTAALRKILSNNGQ